MPKDNEVDEKAIQRDALNDLLDNLSHDAGDVDDFAPSIDDDEDAYWAYHQYHGIISLRRDAATVAELRAEVERLREANQLYSFAMNTAGIDELKRRADAAERRVVELTDIVDRVARCSYSVCTQIDIRGHRWSEEYLDQVLPDILAALTGADPT